LATKPNPKPETATVGTFVPTGKVKATTPVAVKATTIDCPGTNFVCLNGKYTLSGNGTHFACGGKGKFELTLPNGKPRVYTVTAKEAKSELFAEWNEWAKAQAFTYRVSGGKS
jgi:hypothetical protein